MRCKMCGEKALIRLRAYNLNLCDKCLQEFIVRRVKRTINKFKLLKENDKVLVAVSGGKDSLSLWGILNKLDIKTKGFYINLGINGYSDRSEEKALKFAAERGLDLHIERVKDHFEGLGIPELSKMDKRPPCSLCGMIKRYLMNKVAYEGGWVLATGHNLDDEAATLLGNVLDWKEGYLSRQEPKLEGREGFAPRIKPLVLCSEREMAAYAISSGIDYILEECPFSEGATSIFYKGLLNQLEEQSPGSKLRFYLNFLKIKDVFKKDTPQLSPCVQCGYLTTGNLCNFCRLKSKIKKGGNAPL